MIIAFANGNNEAYLKHGRYRLTKEGAEMSLARNKRANLKEALAEQLGGLKQWVRGEENWYAYMFIGACKIDYDNVFFSEERVYMTKECAVEICRMLNAGEIKF